MFLHNRFLIEKGPRGILLTKESHDLVMLLNSFMNSLFEVRLRQKSLQVFIGSRVPIILVAFSLWVLSCKQNLDLFS